EAGIRDWSVTGVQTCALPISTRSRPEFLKQQIQRSAHCGEPHACTTEIAVAHLAMTRGGARSLDRQMHEADRLLGRAAAGAGDRSEERRVGEEGGCRGRRRGV